MLAQINVVFVASVTVGPMCMIPMSFIVDTMFTVAAVVAVAIRHRHRHRHRHRRCHRHRHH